MQLRIKVIYTGIVAFRLMTAGCSNKNDDKYDSNDTVKTQSYQVPDINISIDSLRDGDTFITTGPAGSMEQLHGKIVVVADSDIVMPVKLDNKNILAIGIKDKVTYQVFNTGKNLLLVSPETNSLLENARMLFVTDDGNLLEVKLIEDHLVILTRDNKMLPLAKQ